MGRPLCSGCEEGKPCTGWTIDVTDDGTSYWARCHGPSVVRISASGVPDRHDKGDDE